MKKLITIAIMSAIFGISSLALGTGNDISSLSLKNPQSIYNKDKQKEIADQILRIVKQLTTKENDILSPISDARKSINARNQYATLMNKAISIQAFQETENRYHEILELLGKVKKIQDLKGISEPQTRINARLAIIQNEAIKLQMVRHQSNTEQALINRLTPNRNT